MSVSKVLTCWLAILSVVSAGCKDRPSSGQTAEGRTDPAGGALIGQPGALNILYPTDGAVLDSPTLQLVALANDPGAVPAVSIDGREIELARLRVADNWSRASRSEQDATRSGAQEALQAAGHDQVRPGQVVLHAAVGLSEGQHTITAGANHIQVMVRPAGQAASEPHEPHVQVFRLHPPPIGPGRTVACSKCHHVDSETLGAATTPDSCFTCHEKEHFSVTHMHRIESLVACGMCHAPHGSSAEKALLKDDAAVLCAKCHE